MCIDFCNCSNSEIYFHKNVGGLWNISCHDFNNIFEVGEGTMCCDVGITSIGNTIRIGKDCMLSNNVRIWGDGHSVLKYPSGEVLNKPAGGGILVGNHCWVGERVTLTKNAQISEDCIVGIASVVTKKFTEPHTLLAGSPAQVRKTGISWHRFSPLTYEAKMRKTYEK